MKQVAQNYHSGELAVIDAPAPSCAPWRGARTIALLPDLHGYRADEGGGIQDVAGRQGTRPARPGEEGLRRRPAAGSADCLQEGDEPSRLLFAAWATRSPASSRRWERVQKSSRSVSSLPARATSSRSTPRSTGFRPISAWPCPTVFRLSRPPSPPWVPSPCRVFVKGASRSGTRRAS